jgi:hypothetical protein
MSDENLSFADTLQYLVFDTTTPIDDSVDWVSKQYNQGIGYVGGWFDGVDLNLPTFDDPKDKAIPPTSMPVYTLLSGQSEPVDKGMSFLIKDHAQMRLDSTLRAISFLDSSKILPGDQVRLTPDFAYEVYPNEDVEMGSLVPVSEVRDKLDSEKAHWESVLKESVVPVEEPASAERKAMDFNSAFQAFSPLSIAMAGTFPGITRELMALHLWGDALTGVINFRDPTRESNFGLFDFFAPYIAMTGAAATNKASSMVPF